jgi:hypothetical protein
VFPVQAKPSLLGLKFVSKVGVYLEAPLGYLLTSLARLLASRRSRLAIISSQSVS